MKMTLKLNPDMCLWIDATKGRATSPAYIIKLIRWHMNNPQDTTQIKERQNEQKNTSNTNGTT